jgi:hypothetical protein
MENLWKKFKQETEKDMLKIRNFLDEISFNETSPKEIKTIPAKRISRHLVLDKETLTAINTKPKVSKKKSQKRKASPRKKIYGKLSNLVKEIMETENLSRAQAYRVARKRLLNNF